MKGPFPLSLVLLWLAACSSSYEGQKLNEDGSVLGGNLTGVPYQMTRPEFLVTQTQLEDTKKGQKAKYKIDIAQVPDPKHRYSLNIDPAIFTDIEFEIGYGPHGNISTSSTKTTSQAADFVQSLGEFTANIVQTLAKVGALDEEKDRGLAGELIDLIEKPDANQSWVPNSAKITSRLKLYKGGDKKFLAEYYYRTPYERSFLIWAKACKERDVHSKLLPLVKLFVATADRAETLGTNVHHSDNDTPSEVQPSSNEAESSDEDVAVELGKPGSDVPGARHEQDPTKAGDNDRLICPLPENASDTLQGKINLLAAEVRRVEELAKPERAALVRLTGYLSQILDALRAYDTAALTRLAGEYNKEDEAAKKLLVFEGKGDDGQPQQIVPTLIALALDIATKPGQLLKAINSFLNMPQATWRWRHLLYLDEEISKHELKSLIEDLNSDEQNRLSELRDKRIVVLGVAKLFARRIGLESKIETVPDTIVDLGSGNTAKSPAADAYSLLRKELEVVNAAILAARAALKPKEKTPPPPQLPDPDVALFAVTGPLVDPKKVDLDKLLNNRLKVDKPRYVILLEAEYAPLDRVQAQQAKPKEGEAQ